MTNDKLKAYGQSKQGNFKVVDTIGVPHPYCITPKHLQLNEGIYIGTDSIRESEKRGAVCDICKKRNRKFNEPILTIDEHKQALLVECSKDPKAGENGKELKAYLVSNKARAIRDNYEGFAFMRKF